MKLDMVRSKGVAVVFGNLMDLFFQFWEFNCNYFTTTIALQMMMMRLKGVS